MGINNMGKKKQENLEYQHGLILGENYYANRKVLCRKNPDECAKRLAHKDCEDYEAGTEYSGCSNGVEFIHDKQERKEFAEKTKDVKLWKEK